MKNVLRAKDCFPVVQMMSFDAQNIPIDVWDASEGLPIAGALIMIFLDIILYGLLAAWLDNVLPTEYGTKRPLWFPCQPSFWLKQSPYILRNQDYFQEASEADFEGADIEEVPVGMKNTEALIIANIQKTYRVKP